MPRRKRTRSEERSYSELLLELNELEQSHRARQLKERTLPDEWHRIEREVPVSPRKTRVTLRIDADVAGWFRALGHGYQSRMNRVLRAYVLAVQSREILCEKHLDWKGDEI